MPPNVEDPFTPLPGLTNSSGIATEPTAGIPTDGSSGIRSIFNNPEESFSATPSFPPGAKLTSTLNALIEKRSKFSGKVTEKEQNVLSAYDNLQGIISGQEARDSNKESALISDAQLRTPLGQAANLAVGFGSKTGDVIRTGISAPLRFLRTRFESDISPEQFDLYESANAKDKQRKLLDSRLDYLRKTPASPIRDKSITNVLNKLQQQRLSPEEEFIVSPESVVKEGLTIAQRIGRAKNLGDFLEVVDQQSVISASRVNTRDTSFALEKLQDTAKQTVAEVSQGDTLQGVGTFLEGVAGLAIEDTPAATQLLVEAIPHMVAMIQAGIVYLPAVAIELQDKAIEAYREEHKESPTPEEESLMGLLSVANAGMDRVAAGITLQSTNIMKGILKSSTVLSERVPKAILTGLGRVSAPVSAAVVEGSTEGTQNVLEQVAKSIRDPKIDPVPALVDTAVGSVIGTAFSGPGVVRDIAASTKPILDTANKTTKELKGKTKDKLTGLSETIKEAATKNTDALIKEKSSSEPETVIKRIINDGFSGLTSEQRKERIKAVILLNGALKDTATETGTTSTNYDETIAELTKQHLSLELKDSTNKSVPDHVKNITSDSATDVEKVNSINSVADTIDKGSVLPLKTLETISGSTLFADATPKAKETVRQSIALIKKLSEVSDEVQNGNKQKGTKGVLTHLDDINQAVLAGSKELGQVTIDSLATWKSTQATKLAAYKKAKVESEANNGAKVTFQLDGKTKSYHPVETAQLFENIVKDLNAISSTLDAATQIFNKGFNAKPTTPSAVTPPTAKASAVVVKESSKTVSKKMSVLDKIKQPLTNDPALAKEKIKAINLVGSTSGQLSTELQTRRTDLINQLKNVSDLNQDQLLDLNLDLRNLLKDIREGVTSKVDKDVIDNNKTVGLKGSHQKNLTNNLLNDVPNSKSLVNPSTKNKTIGTKPGTKVKGVFKSTPIEKLGLFNIVHNFFSRYEEKGFTKAMENKVGKVSKEELSILDSLTEFNSSYGATIESLISFLNTTKIFPEHVNKSGNTVLSGLDQNVLGYLIKEDSTGKRYINENLVGVMSTVMYDWLGTRATGTLFNTNSDINSILGRESDAQVWPDEHSKLRYIGSSRTTIAETLGRTVVKQLGLTVTDTVDGNMLDRLAISIGLTMVAGGVKDKILEEHFLDKATYASFLKRDENSTVEGRATPFIKLIAKPGNINKAPKSIDDIIDVTRNSTGFLNRVFGVESNDKYVTTEPVTKVVNTIGNTRQQLPKVFKDALKQKQKVVWEVKENLHGIVTSISRESLERMAGVKSIEDQHVSEAESTEAKNTDLGRLIDKYFASINKLNSEGGIFQDIFFQYKTDDNLRARMVNNMLNPVGNKLHRHLVGAKSWNTTVPDQNQSDAESIRANFKLAVVQSFGFKIDKENSINSINEFDRILADPIVQKALDGIKKIKEGKVTSGIEKDVEAGVSLGGQQLHSLDGLVALSAYSPTKSFETNLGIEVDGVTNGLAIGLMQAPIESNNDQLLSSVGIFLNSKEGINYPEWASVPGNLDLYQRLVSDWVNNLTSEYPNDPALIALEGLVGAFVSQEIVQDTVVNTVTDLGRSFAKEPMMFTSYGSSVEGAVTELANQFLSKIYGKLRAAAKSENIEQDTKDIVEGFYAVLGIPVSGEIDFSSPLNVTFGTKEIQAFNGIVNSTYGKSLEDALDNTFSEFFQFRDSINTMTAVMYEVFITKYNQEIAKKQKEVGSRKLSTKEQREVFDSLKKYQPLVKSAFSEKLDDSFLIIKEAKTREYGDTQSTVQISVGDVEGIANKSMTAVVSNSTYQTPGAKALTTLTQGQDAAIQTKSKLSYDFLDIFDAKILAVDKVDVGTQLTNQQMWDVTTDYSVMDSTHESFKRIISLATKDNELRKAAIRGVNARRSKKDQITVNQFNKEILQLKTLISTNRKKIKETPDVVVSQFAHTKDSTYVVNPTKVTDDDISKSVDNLFDEISALEQHLDDSIGSSTTPIDFDNFNSQFDATLNANNTLDIFDKMGSFGNKKESPKHASHLKDVLTNIVNKILHSTDAIEYKVGETTDVTHGAAMGEKVYINASTANRLNNNNEMSTQETQVHELLHVVLNYPINNSFQIRKQLRKLFNTVDKGIRDIYGEEGWKVFMHKDANGNNLTQVDQATEEAAAKARYDYIFNNTRVHNSPSKDPLTGKIQAKQTNDYLTEFVSFGLTNETFRDVLASIDNKSKTDTTGLPLQEKLSVWFNNALDWINSLLGNPRHLKADAQLRALVDQIAVVTNKQRNGLLQLMDSARDFNGAASAALYNKIVKPVIDWRMEQAKRPETIIGKAADIISIIPLTYHNTEYRNRVKQVLRTIGIVEEFVLTKLVREIQGTKASNLVWHTLLRQSKHLVDSARKSVSSTQEQYIRDSFIAGQPNKDESVALTRVMYKSDIVTLLDTHTLPGLIDLLKDQTSLENTIDSVKNELSIFGTNSNYYNTQAEGLGNLIATGRNPSKIQAFNAHNIANLLLDTRRNKAKVIGDVVIAEEIIDRLATLYALKAMEQDSKSLVANVMEREHSANNQDNGILATLYVYKNFKEEALDTLFKGNKIQTVKGYTTETFNPRTDIKVGTHADKDALLEQGYVPQDSVLFPDPKDPNQSGRQLYVLKDAVGLSYLKGIVSLTSKVAKGSTQLDGHVSLKSLTPRQDADRDRDAYIKSSELAINKQFNGTFKFKDEASLIPIVNEQGDISGFRYIMDEATRINLLERDDRFDVVMGSMFGSIKDKVNSKQVNRKVVELAYEDFQAGFSDDPGAYVKIHLNSPDARYKELYSLVPEDMRRDMVDVWGKKEIFIRRELADLIFGYRKWSITSLGENTKSLAKVHKLFNTASVRHIEAIWQEVVSVAKTNIVIRTPGVLIGNFTSNAILSLVKGVSFEYMIKNQALAINALNSYQKELRARDLLQIKLNTDSSLTANQKTNLQARINDLTSELTTNPVSEMIDDGVFQAITEDLEVSRSPYNFRDKLLSDLKLDKLTNHDNALIRNSVQQSFMTEETSVFKLLMKATQYSDFIARYALHTHNIEVKKMSKEASLKDVIETFVNYDIPTSKQLQYINDMGFFMFSKFMFRIQKVIFTLLKDRPVSTAIMLLTQQVVGDAPDILDSVGVNLDGRAGFFLGPVDTATNVSGLKNLGEMVGFD